MLRLIDGSFDKDGRALQDARDVAKVIAVALAECEVIKLYG